MCFHCYPADIKKTLTTEDDDVKLEKKSADVGAGASQIPMVGAFQRAATASVFSTQASRRSGGHGLLFCPVTGCHRLLTIPTVFPVHSTIPNTTTDKIVPILQTAGYEDGVTFSTAAS